jgi:tetratricopeptide (TPR) repeat protein
MTWASEAGQGPLALELACNLRHYFWTRVMYRESQKWLTNALDLVGDDESLLVAVGTAYALTDATNIGGGAEILALAERARQILANSTDDLPKGLLSNALGPVEMSNDVRRADELLAEATQLLRSAEDPRWFAPVQNRYLSSWLMNSRESEHEILSLVDEAVAEGTQIRSKVVRTAFSVLAEEYEEVIASAGHLTPGDEWGNSMLLLFRMQAERATGRPERALESIKQFAAMPGALAEGWMGWHTGLAHMQLGDLDAAIKGFSAPGAYDPDRPTAYDRANVAWFWSMVAERRGEHDSAAVLLGFAEAVSEKTSVSLKAFDQRLVEASRSAVRAALGERAYGELLGHGATIAWEDLPLVHT